MNNIYAWIPSIVLMIFIFFMSSRQNITVTHEFTTDFIIFKSLHVLEYALLTLLYFHALRKTTHVSYKTGITYAVFMALSYGIFDEVHQTFVPSRSGVPRDVFIDLIGISLMGLILRKYKLFFNKLLSST